MKNHMKAELVSVIMPVFNRASLVITTLQSILDQIYQNWECIIIDDGSTQDDYVKIYNFAKSDDRFMVLKRPNYKLKGANACRNYGIENSKGEFIIFFDSDDLMSKSFIENRVNIFKKHLEYEQHPRTATVAYKFNHPLRNDDVWYSIELNKFFIGVI